MIQNYQSWKETVYVFDVSDNFEVSCKKISFCWIYTKFLSFWESSRSIRPNYLFFFFFFLRSFFSVLFSRLLLLLSTSTSLAIRWLSLLCFSSFLSFLCHTLYFYSPLKTVVSYSSSSAFPLLFQLSVFGFCFNDSSWSTPAKYGQELDSLDIPF